MLEEGMKMLDEGKNAGGEDKRGGSVVEWFE